MPRTVLVTGSANGIGAATAELLKARGEKVIGLDLQGADICADLCTPEGQRAAIAEALDLGCGKLDAIVACAGLASSDAAAMIGVNYCGTVALLEGLRPALSASPAPRAAVITSSATILPTAPPVVAACLAGDVAAARVAAQADSTMVYASTKRALSRWLRRTAILPEWAGAGILLNGIAPGTVLTNMTAPILATEQGREMLRQATPIAVAEYAPPQDIAPLLAFLASEECRYMVGQVIFIDGGKDVIMRGDDIF
jgi:NAD(P)-dependent dehydrogenase (short-subunit alcohol dehydrogenase family)